MNTQPLENTISTLVSGRQCPSENMSLHKSIAESTLARQQLHTGHWVGRQATKGNQAHTRRSRIVLALYSQVDIQAPGWCAIKHQLARLARRMRQVSCATCASTLREQKAMQRGSNSQAGETQTSIGLNRPGSYK